MVGCMGHVTLVAIVLLMTSWIQKLHAQPGKCVSDSTIGDPPANRSHVNDTNGRVYIASTPGIYQFSCSGYIKQFDYFCHKDGVVKFQIWRPAGPDEFTLVAEHIEHVTGCQGVARTVALVAGADGLPVFTGDGLGIWQDPGGVVPYDEYGAGSSACCKMRYDDISTSVGNTYTLPQQAVSREYSLRMTLDAPLDPVFVNLPGNVTVYEDVPVDTWVFSVHAMDKDVSAGSQQLYYYLDHNHLSIDLNTGKVRTTAPLDHESAPSHTLSVQVSDGLTNITGTLTIYVLDIKVEEFDVINLPNMVTVDVKTADCSQIFSIVTSSTQASNDLTFNLLTSTPYDNTFQVVRSPTNDTVGHVTCKGGISDHQISEYKLQISVVDASGAFSIGPRDLIIHLINLNTPPFFLNLPAVTRVPETHTGGKIYKLRANDTDSDLYNFTLEGVEPAYLADLFTLEPINGSLSMKPSPIYDFETGRLRFDVIFTVADRLGRSRKETLVIYVYDVNEPPVCHTPTYRLSIPEKLSRDTQLPVTFNATDPDQDDMVSFTLPAGPETRHFRVSGTSLFIAEPVDLGVGPNQIYNFTVMGIDRGGLTCSAEVIVNVTQVNDPHFIDNLPDVVFLNAQATMVNDLVFAVSVSPVEANDEFTYSWDSISPSDGSFLLDPITGEVKLARSIQDTQTSMYNLSIYVTDRDGHAAGPAHLLVYVNNIKRAPYIVNLPQTITLSESITSSQSLIQVEGEDADADTITRYNLIAVHPASGVNLFQLDASSGDVSSIMNPGFDYEAIKSYTLTFTAEDGLYTSRPGNLTVLITDVNEPPQATELQYTGNVPEETAIGTVITLYPHDLLTSDPDAGDSVTLHLKQSTFSNLFTVIGNQLLVARRLDRDAGLPEVVSLEVITSDVSGLQGVTLSVTLSVTDVNDHPPIFTSQTYTGSVEETSYGGTFILTVSASDADATTPNNDFYFFINDTYRVFDEGQTFFMVDSYSGDVRVKHQIDFDRFPVVEFELLAVDEGVEPGPLTATTTIFITVDDINDERPYFVDDFISLEVASNEDPGFHIAQLNATDDDSFRASNLSYYYLRYSPYFELTGKSGEIAVKRDLEENTKYVLYCLATDNGQPEHISNVAIVRVDAFKPADYLVDIELSIPLLEFQDVQDDFLRSMRDVIKPWYPRIHRVYGQQDFTGKRRLLATSQDTMTVVTMYALENQQGDELQHLTENKDFVGRDSLLGELRTNIYGDPSKELQTTDFAEYLVTKVSPTHPNWFKDTVAGIATVTVLSLLAAALLAIVIVCCCRKNPRCGCEQCSSRSFRDCCPRSRPVTPEKAPPPTRRPLPSDEPYTGPEFSLRYKKPEEYTENGTEAGGAEVKPPLTDETKSRPSEPARIKKTGFLVGLMAARKQRRVNTPPGDAPLRQPPTTDNSEPAKHPGTADHPEPALHSAPVSTAWQQSRKLPKMPSQVGGAHPPATHHDSTPEPDSWKKSVRPPKMIIDNESDI